MEISAALARRRSPNKMDAMPILRFKSSVLVTVAAVAASLLAPANASRAQSASAHSGSSSSAQSSKAAKDPEVIDLDGFRKILADHRGSPLLITIWATWCEPCRDEYPMINDLARQFAPQHLAVVGVSFDDDAEINLVRHFLARNSPIFVNYRKKMGHVETFDHGVDPTWSGVLPVNFFYAADGRLLFRLDGERPRQVYEQAIRATIAAGDSSHR
jgi:thiol-disulfide isomerase/thioredoxin